MLVGLSFAQTFTFSRADPAPVRDAAGMTVIAAPDVPRFDHDGAGLALGLLVEGGETVGQADRCLARAGDWEVAGEATVFHELVDGAGVLVRRALYSLSVRATVNALLASGGHHRSIGAVAGYLRNQGGFVRFRDLDWELSHAIAADATRAIGDEAGRALVDG